VSHCKVYEEEDHGIEIDEGDDDECVHSLNEEAM
jgi:hypothetical protein